MNYLTAKIKFFFAIFIMSVAVYAASPRIV